MQQYTDEVNAQVIIFLLKEHGIRRVIASPGTTNMAFIASIQNDPYFSVLSSVDERSAAYIACGLAAESGEPVVISCTGATASRNYLPGMTEAYYRKLPVLAITSSQAFAKIGHHIPQVIDRSSIPNDVARVSVSLPIVNDEADIWECEMKVNTAILELKRHGGGPAHINLPTTYSKSYCVQNLPKFRKIDRINIDGPFPLLPMSRIAIFIGSKSAMTESLVLALDAFCSVNNAAIFYDHTSGYYGSKGLHFSLIGIQTQIEFGETKPDLIIHIGEVTGDYHGIHDMQVPVWRVSPDGELRDTFGHLRYVFEMSEESFFDYYSKGKPLTEPSYLTTCQQHLERIRSKVPELPFSNIWVASRLASKLPANSTIHFGILNSLRSWNFFDLPGSVRSSCNVGGFGIDGGLSALIGASFFDPNRLYFCVLGDLAFFYDINVLGNRHVGRNLRILLVNNGKGTEFRHVSHPAGQLGDAADEFIAAAGHFGKKSKVLVQHYSEDLGFKYLSAHTKEEFEMAYSQFVNPKIGTQSILFEVFTNSEDESNALEMMSFIEKDFRSSTKATVANTAKLLFGEDGTRMLKKIIGK
jgi:2-succinyl-5-enolpyruvyl-6-hydroxy-3-cyclohexene-1-carboxylate synthase